MECHVIWIRDMNYEERRHQNNRIIRNVDKETDGKNQMDRTCKKRGGTKKSWRKDITKTYNRLE